MKFFIQKHAFTFVELIVGIAISSIIFLVVFGFLSDAFTQILPDNEQAHEVSDLFTIRDDIGNFIDTGYSEISIISSGTTFSNTLYLKNIDVEKGGVLFGIVDTSTDKIKVDDTFSENYLGYRLLSQGEVSEIDNDNTKVYSLLFSNAKLYKGFVFTNFFPKLFSNPKVLDIDLGFTTAKVDTFYGIDMGRLSQKELQTQIYNLVY